MNRICIAFTFALILSCASAEYWVNATLCSKTVIDTIFSNCTMLKLDSLAEGSLDILAVNSTKVDATWKFWSKNLDTKYKTLEATTGLNGTDLNATKPYGMGRDLIFVNGYAIRLTLEKDQKGQNQVFVTQTRLEGNVIIPRFPVSFCNSSHSSVYLLWNVTIGDTVYVYYQYGKGPWTDAKFNVTSFVIGSSTVGNSSFVAEKTYSAFSAAGGKALPNNSTLILQQKLDGDRAGMQEIVFDSNNGIVSKVLNSNLGYDQSSCKPFVTDNIFYGTFCFNRYFDKYTYYIRTGTNKGFVNFTSNYMTYHSFYVYGSDLVIVYSKTTNATYKCYTYEIYNLENNTLVERFSNFICQNPQNSEISFHGLSLNGIYALAYDFDRTGNNYISNVTVTTVLSNYTTPDRIDITIDVTDMTSNATDITVNGLVHLPDKTIHGVIRLKLPRRSILVL